MVLQRQTVEAVGQVSSERKGHSKSGRAMDFGLVKTPAPGNDFFFLLFPPLRSFFQKTFRDIGGPTVPIGVAGGKIENFGYLADFLQKFLILWIF